MKKIFKVFVCCHKYIHRVQEIKARIYKWNLETKGPATILACSSNLSFSEELISVPKQVEFPTTLGTAFGYYYAPKNGGYTCTTDKAPPLLVKAQ